MHTDAAQSVGKIPVRVDDLGVDLLSVAGHKLYAPKGIGALFIRNGVILEKLIHGANHERNLRAGTENVLEIVGLGEAAELVDRNLKAYSDRMKEMRDRLERALMKGFPAVRVHGHPEKTPAQHSQHRFPGTRGKLHSLGVAANRRGIRRRRLPQRRRKGFRGTRSHERSPGIRHGNDPLFRRPLHDGRRDRPSGESGRGGRGAIAGGWRGEVDAGRRAD